MNVSPSKYRKPAPRCRVYSLGSVFAVLAATVASGLIVCAPARADDWALLIGIDRYQDATNIAPLGGADNDASALAKALTESAGFPASHVHLLTSSGDQKPLKNAILRELEALRQRVQPGDKVFVAFSGHGVEADGVPYLLPYDADISSPDLIRDTGIAESKFRDYLKAVPAKALVLVFDMCRVNADRSGRAGVTSDAQLSSSQMRGLDFSKVVKASGDTTPGTDGAKHPEIVATFFACSPEHRSYEWQDKERGYFSWFLEQGIRGQAATNGKISLDGLKRYLATAVPKAVRENEVGKEQVPTGDIVGPLDAGDFVFAKAALIPLPPPIAESDPTKELKLRYVLPNGKATVIFRYSLTSRFTQTLVDGQTFPEQIDIVELATIRAVPGSDEVEVEEAMESSNIVINNQPTLHPGPDDIPRVFRRFRPDGWLTSYRTDPPPEKADGDVDAVRLSRAILPTCPKQTVPLGGTWTAEYPEGWHGAPAATGRFTYLGPETIHGHRTAKVAFKFAETGGSPFQADGTVWMDLETGIMLRTDGKVQNMPFGPPGGTVSGTIHCDIKE